MEERIFLDTEVDISKLYNDLLQYFLILNTTNFFLFPLKEKVGILKVRVRVKVIDMTEYSF